MSDGDSIKFDKKNKIILAVIIIIIAIAGIGAYLELSAPKESARYDTLIIDDQKYKFSEDIRDSLKIPLYDAAEMRELLLDSENITIVFDDSPEDNSLFAVMSYNIVYKHTRYQVWRLKKVNFNSTITDKANFIGTTIWLKGPHSGANESSVKLEKNIIIVQGLNNTEAIRAGERLSLLLLNVVSYANK